MSIFVIYTIITQDTGLKAQLGLLVPLVGVCV